jgi:hypothetical protein
VVTCWAGLGFRLLRPFRRLRSVGLHCHDGQAGRAAPPAPCTMTTTASHAVQGRWGLHQTPSRPPTRPETCRSIHLEQGFEATRLNTGTMTDLATLAATLRANFCSLHIPGSKRGHQLSGDWWATVRAMRAESLAAYAYRDRLRRLLVERGHHRFLHHLEADPAGGWRLHFFVADVAALTLLDELTEGTCGPGDPVSFNPKEFVSERLRHLFKIDTHS